MREDKNKRRKNILVGMMMTLLFVSAQSVLADDIRVEKMLVERIVHEDIENISEDLFEKKAEIRTFDNRSGKITEEITEPEEKFEEKDKSSERDKKGIIEFGYIKEAFNESYYYVEGFDVEDIQFVASKVHEEYSLIEKIFKDSFEILIKGCRESAKDEYSKSNDEKSEHETSIVWLQLEQYGFGKEPKCIGKTIFINCIHILMEKDVVSYSVLKQKRCIKRYQTVF